MHTTYSAAVTFNKAKKELDIMNAEEYRAYRTVSNPLSDMGATTDWFDAVTRLGVTHMHTLTFSGGNARTNYRVTATTAKHKVSTCVPTVANTVRVPLSAILLKTAYLHSPPI